MGAEVIVGEITAESAVWARHVPARSSGAAECPDAKITSRLSATGRRFFHAIEGR